MDVKELAAEVRQNIARLRRELADEEKFLSRLESRVAGAAERGIEAPPAEGGPAQLSGHLRGSGALHATVTTVKRGEKREIVSTIVSGRPGRWTTRQVRDELALRGIDPEAGTPVKNILWNLAKEKFVIAHGSGEYEFPATRENGRTPQEEMSS